MTSKVCVIGAGAAGLCAARHLLAATPSVTPVVFEQSGVLGGTWVYTDEVGRDGRHGLPIHSREGPLGVEIDYHIFSRNLFCGHPKVVIYHTVCHTTICLQMSLPTICPQKILDLP